MKTKIILAVLTAIILSCCTYPGYLPSGKMIDVNQYGSHIKVTTSSGSFFGELIAVDTTQLVILSDSSKIKKSDERLIRLPAGDIRYFKIQYASPKQYGWSIPVYMLASISHGWWLILSLPINALVTSLITGSATSFYQYNQKDISFEELKMFARFPQGMPPNIDLASIK
jgi:hypothetical protein